MIAVIYRWHLKPGYEAAFVDAWAPTTAALVPSGAMGFAPFQAEDGTHYVIAKWPDQETRARVFAGGGRPDLPAAMQAAVEEHFPELVLQEVKNLGT